MNTLTPSKVGLALGGIFAVFHFLWSVLVALGWAQWALDWVFRLHFITPPYTVGPFSLKLAVGLIVMTFVVGYVFGWAFAVVWNKLRE
jgi:hypothetical protein